MVTDFTSEPCPVSGAETPNTNRRVRRHPPMEKASGSREGDDTTVTSTSPGARTAEADAPETMDWESRFKYLLADFDNFRRRVERERAGTRVQVEAALLRRLLPLIEGFQSAEESSSKLPASDPFRRGFELLGHELDGFLRSIGFATVARVGDPFHPDEHEAVGEAPRTGGLADGAVAEIVQQGYRFQGGLLRPAKVIVARTAPVTEPDATPSDEPDGKKPPEVDEPSD